MCRVGRLFHGVEGGEGLFWAGADGEVLGEIRPAHFTGGVDQEFGWSRDVCTVLPAVKVHEIPPANHVFLGIGKNGKRVALRATQIFGILGRIDTDGDHANFSSVEFG